MSVIRSFSTNPAPKTGFSFVPLEYQTVSVQHIEITINHRAIQWIRTKASISSFVQSKKNILHLGNNLKPF